MDEHRPVERAPDPAHRLDRAERAQSAGAPALRVDVTDHGKGDRHHRPTAEGGEQFQLYPYDPASVVRALPIEGRLFGQEVLAYPLPQPATRVCINVATISPPHEEPSQWLCFDSKQPIEHSIEQPIVAQGAP